MEDKTQVAVLAEAGLFQLKRMQAVLTDAGIEAAIIRPPTPGGG
jgi:hypothetical protein